MSTPGPVEAAFLSALAPQTRARFDDTATLTETLTELRGAAIGAYGDLAVEATVFAAELARRLGPTATPAQLAQVRPDHVHLAIACAAGDERAIRRLEAEFLDEVDATAIRLRARADQADEVRSHVRRVLLVSEPGRPAALREFSGRGDLRSYLRVITTRELVRVINKARREIGIGDDAFFDLLSPASDPQLGYLRELYRTDVEAAVRDAIAAIAEPARALLRYSVVHGWSVDRIAALYGVHRATAARRVTAARAELGDAIRVALCARLAISIDQVDSIVRLVQSRIDVSLERLLDAPPPDAEST